MQGILNLDKPAGISSAHAVARVKRLLPRGTKIGHAGTLDPFATGVLVLLVGKATRLCEQFMGQPKQYETVVKLGATTPTLDPDSPEVVGTVIQPPGREAVEKALLSQVGEIQQLPPSFSALKVAGQRAYDLARAGETVRLEPRQVRVYSIDLLDYAWPMLALRIDCGRGTYIRAIGRDIGEALGTGGYLLSLRRTRVGNCWAKEAVSLERLAAEGVEKHLQAAASCR